MLAYESFIKLNEIKGNGKCVFTFGRLNPPHIGHLKLIKKLQQVASKNNCPALIYLSHSNDKDKNPLNYDEKCSYLEKILPRDVKLIKTSARTVDEIMKELSEMGYKDIIMIVGSDRLKAFEWVKKYLNDYNIKSFDIVSSGERDDDSNDSETKASASLMRKLAKENNFEEFKKYSPFTDRVTKQLFERLRLILK